MGLARSIDFTPAFECARMYLGPPPSIDVARLYGVTSFEFG
jgi:hypothetical protein